MTDSRFLSADEVDSNRLPFGELTDETEIAPADCKVPYLQAHNGHVTLFNKMDTHQQWIVSISAFDVTEPYSSQQITREEAEKALQNLTGGEWTYAEWV